MLYYLSMKNINKNSILKKFKVLSVIAFATLFIPVSANAAQNYVFGTPDGVNYGNGYNSSYYNNYGQPYQGYVPAPTYAPGYGQGYTPTPAPATNTQAYNYDIPTLYSNQPVAKTTSTKTVAKKTTPATVASAVGTGVPSGNLNGYMLVPIPASATGTQTASNTGATSVNPFSTLAASVVLGTNSFLPAGILQWILLAILILFIILLTRRVFGARKRYMMVPLKHS